MKFTSIFIFSFIHPTTILSRGLISIALLAGCGTSGSQNTNMPGSQGTLTGKGGSMARFTIQNDNLITVKVDGWRSELATFDLSDPEDPTWTRDLIISDAVETIHANGELLYLGAETGMYILQPQADENGYEIIGSHSHQKSCDPVVVQDNYAYVTLASGNRCMTGEDALHVYEVEDPMKPVLVNSIPMNTPAGLGVWGDLLYVCDLRRGLHIYNRIDPVELDLMEVISYVRCTDIIIQPNLLITTAIDGIYLFENNQERLLASKIEIKVAEEKQ